MPKPSKLIKTKIALGYLLLIVILLLSIRFIYKEMEKLSVPDQYETELNEKRKTTQKVLSRLYQSELAGQSVSTGQIAEFASYHNAMKEAYKAVDSLKTFITDSLQRLRIDSISMLLVQKERNMIGLLKILNEANADEIYRRNIEEVLSSQDTILHQPHVQKKIVTKQNSYTVRKKPKNFFKRLAEVFAPGKEDSATITNTSKEVLTDTLLQTYNPADTVAVILRTIQTRISDKQRELNEQLVTKSNHLRHNGWVLSTKINQILSDFEQEDTSRSQARLEQEKNIRQQSTRTLAYVAIASILLATFFLILIWRDITKSNHYRSELEIAKKKAEDLLVTREKLMLTITHDIKAPLSSIIGYIGLLDHPTDIGRQKNYLDNMKGSSAHLLKLVNNLLDFHRLDSHKMEVQRTSFSPKQLFDEIKMSFDPLANQKNLKLYYHIDPKLDGFFISDPFRIRQIAENLLSNAIKFTHEGNIRLTVHYQNNFLYFTVSDTGCGMTEEEQQKVFQEFTRLHSAQAEEGFGLGLSITQKLVFLLEGTLELHSTPGKGSSFCARLPLFPVAGKNKETPSKKVEKNPAIHKSLRLLLIDDDKIQLQLTSAMLATQAVSCICCEQPDELLDYLRKESFDLLLTDLQMPALNGFDLLTLLRQSNIPQAKTIPIIAVTARGEMEEPEFLAKGFAGCLRKPFSLKELLKLINTVSGQKLLPETTTEHPFTLSNGLDFSALTAFSENDPEAAKRIIRTFAEETEKNRKAFERFLEKKDVQGITAIAHKLLPLFTLIKANDCVAPLSRLEKQKGKVFSEEIKTDTRQVLDGLTRIGILAGRYTENI